MAELQCGESWEIVPLEVPLAPHQFCPKPLYSCELFDPRQSVSPCIFWWGFSFIFPRNNTETEEYVDLLCARDWWLLHHQPKDKLFHEESSPANCIYSIALDCVVGYQFFPVMSNICFHCEIFCIFDGMQIVWVILHRESRWLQCRKHKHSPYHRMFIAVFRCIFWGFVQHLSHSIIQSRISFCVLFDITSEQSVELNWLVFVCVLFWCQCIWFWFWSPSWFDQITNQEQLCGFWKHVSLPGFFRLCSSWSVLRCLQTYDKASREDWTFEGMKSTLSKSKITLWRLFAFELCEVKNKLHVCSWTGRLVLYGSDSCFQELQTIRSQKSRARIPSNLNLASKEMIFDSVELWETEVCFLDIQLIGTTVWLPKMHNVPLDVDFVSLTISRKVGVLKQSPITFLQCYPHDNIVCIHMCDGCKISNDSIVCHKPLVHFVSQSSFRNRDRYTTIVLFPNLLAYRDTSLAFSRHFCFVVFCSTRNVVWISTWTEFLWNCLVFSPNLLSRSLTLP